MRLLVATPPTSSPRVPPPSQGRRSAPHLDRRRFVVVGRRGRALGEPAQKEAEARKKKKKSGGAPADFYHFQQHERKRSQLLKLREQFEQDKSKIAKRREARAFKPY